MLAPPGRRRQGHPDADQRRALAPAAGAQVAAG
jgi:hypothetical protein